MVYMIRPGSFFYAHSQPLELSDRVRAAQPELSQVEFSTKLGALFTVSWWGKWAITVKI